MNATSPVHVRFPHLRETAVRAAAIGVLLVVIALLGSTYLGHAKGPYGVCYGQSGRPIPCAIGAGTSAKK